MFSPGLPSGATRSGRHRTRSFARYASCRCYTQVSVRITCFVHGTTTDNEQGTATGWLPGELSALGREQAAKLRECNYGDMNGRSDNFKDTMEAHIDRSFPGGESYRDVERRIASFLAFLKQNYDGKHITESGSHRTARDAGTPPASSVSSSSAVGTSCIPARNRRPSECGCSGAHRTR